MIVATAGHIDHGKTSLVKALSGVDTDRLPEEKARGISIDIGFAYWQVPGGGTIGFVDVPGHERFVRNMLAGVCGIDYALLVVAADDGVMPQTREHLNILDLLSVQRGIAVVTKVDRVSAERVAEVATEVQALLQPTALRNAPILSCSAVTGHNIGKLRALLAQAAAEFRRDTRDGRRFRHAIDRVFTVAGSGTIVTGTVFDGTVHLGDKLQLSPSGLPVRVRGIQVQGRAVDAASAGERCALNLAGASLDQVRRGDWLLHPLLHEPTRCLDVRLHLLPGEAQPLKHWAPVHLHLATRDVTARVALRRGAAIEPGGSAIAQLIVDQPIAALHGDRFILRDQSALRTLGGGSVLDPWAPQRRHAAHRTLQLQALDQHSAEGALRALAECSPSGIDIEAFGRAFNLDEAAMTRLLAAAHLLVLGKAQGAVALPMAAVDGLQQRVMNALQSFHEASPQSLGIDVNALRIQCAPLLSAATFLSMLRNMAEARQIELTGSVARRPQHASTENQADHQLWQLSQVALQRAGHQGLTVAELAQDTGLKEAVLRDFLYRKAKTGELVRVKVERFYLRGTMASFAAIAQALAQSVPGGRFSAAQFRDRAGIGRTLSIEVLEALDRVGVTQRLGDVRVIRQHFFPILGAAESSPPVTSTAKLAHPDSAARDR